jgi:hypothetical protein
MTDPIRAAMERLIARLPASDPNGPVPAWSDSFYATCAALSADGPAVPEGREPAAVAGEPGDAELLGLDQLAAAWNAQADAANGWDELGLDEIIVWAQRQALARWGRQPTPPAEGEVTELVAWLQTSAREWRDLGQYSEGAKCHRAAELFQQQHPTPVPVVVPVPVTERPWERGGWLDLDGECWWCPPDGPPCWLMIPPSMAYAGWLLPSHALPVPAGGGAVMITPNRPPLSPAAQAVSDAMYEVNMDFMDENHRIAAAALRAAAGRAGGVPAHVVGDSYWPFRDGVESERQRNLAIANELEARP